MSLKLWLPLKGNLENLGLTETKVTQANLTVSDDGKIGNCYSFNGSNSYVLVDNGLTLDDKEWSYCCWARQNADYGGSSNCLYSQRVSVNNSQRAIFMYPDKRIFIDEKTRYSTTLETSADLTQWCHYVILRRASNIEVHINGELVLSYEWTNYPTSLGTKCSFGSSQAGSETSISGNCMKGEMNDIRLYNHALSVKEIKELAKGLVCHYSLDNNGCGNPNLLKNSNFTEGSNGMYGWNFYGGATYTKMDDCVKVVTSVDAAGIWTSRYDSIATGDMATFSTYVKADSEMTIYIGVDGNTTSNCITFTVGPKWQLISISKAKTTNNANPRVYGNGTYYVKCLKYELGSKATPWCPNSADSIYSKMEFNTNIEQDISGYNNNGTKTSVTTKENSKKYAVSTKFDGTNSFIACGRNGMVKDAITLSIWAYADDWSTISIGRFCSCAEIGGWAIGISSDSTSIDLWMGTGTTANSYAITRASTIANLTAGWHMFTETYDGYTAKAYMDGVLIQTIEKYTTKTPIFYNATNGIFIGAEASTTQTTPLSTNHTACSLSDFRIYATALSADDVKELYNVPARIDNIGKLYALDFTEEV